MAAMDEAGNSTSEAAPDAVTIDLIAPTGSVTAPLMIVLGLAGAALFTAKCLYSTSK